METLIDEDLRQKSKQQFDALPKWHQQNPALIANALMSSKQAAPHLSELADSLLPKMPRIVRASQNLRSINIENASHLFTLEDGINLPWISFDAKQSRNVLLFDIDHDSGLDLAEELPQNIRPTLIFDPYSGRSHGVLPLVTPVLRGGKIGPEVLADLAHQLIAKHLNATPLPVGSLVKNPFGLSRLLVGVLPRRTPEPSTPLIWEAFQQAQTGLLWHTVAGSKGAELKDVIAFLADEYGDVCEPRTKRIFRHRGEPSNLGRNCALFDMVRFHCYDHNLRDGGEIMKKAQEINQTLQPPLPFAEVQATARSIGKFMQSRYKPKSALSDRKGVMGLAGSSLEMKDKQKLSAIRTNDIKTDNTDHKIRQAMKHWPTSQKMTQAALAKVSGVSLKTIKRRWKALKDTP